MEKSVAVYLDFENLAISAEAVYPSQNKPLQIEPIVDFAARKGTVAIKKAYADWSKQVFAKYQGLLMEQGFELIHLPETNVQGKNGSDVRLAVDVMEQLELLPSIQTIMIGSGDSDFIPVIQRVRSRSKEVILIGFEHSVGRLVKINSTEFKSLEELIGMPDKDSLSGDMVEDVDENYGRTLMIRFMKVGDTDDPVPMSRLKLDLLRLDSAFSERRLGFGSFKQFVESFQGTLVEKIVRDKETGLPVVFFNEAPEDKGVQKNEHKEAQRFLQKNLRFLSDPAKRKTLTESLFATIRSQKQMSMTEMADQIHDKSLKVAKADIRKFINTLFSGGAFYQLSTEGPLLNRQFQFKDYIQDARAVDRIYIRRIREILKNKYAALDEKELAELLHNT
jgi:uncharacterized protein (TIGR00288 family)